MASVAVNLQWYDFSLIKGKPILTVYTLHSFTAFGFLSYNQGRSDFCQISDSQQSMSSRSAAPFVCTSRGDHVPAGDFRSQCTIAPQTMTRLTYTNTNVGTFFASGG